VLADDTTKPTRRLHPRTRVEPAVDDLLVSVGARDAEVFGDRPEAAVDEQEGHAPDAELTVEESFPGWRAGLRRARERRIGRVDVECLPSNRAGLPAAQNR
jgi:hypothetical protein